MAEHGDRTSSDSPEERAARDVARLFLDRPGLRRVVSLAAAEAETGVAGTVDEVTDPTRHDTGRRSA